MQPIEVAQEADIPAILDLMRECMPLVPRSREVLLWQYFRVPFGQTKLYIIRDGSHLAALYSTFSVDMRVAGETVPGRMQLDVMTHPAHRGRGIHSRLIGNCLKEARESGEISFGLPNEQAEGGFRRTPGFVEVGRVPLRLRPVSTGDGAPKQGHPFIRPIFGEFGSFATDVWKSTKFGASVQKDARYLNWRYSKPSQKYFFFEIGEGDGVLVLKVYQTEKERLLHICELFLRPRLRKLLPEILDFCEGFAHEHRTTMMTAWLFAEHEYAPAFDEFGLRLKEIGRYLFFTTESKEREKILSCAKNWHFTQGDSDVY